MVCERRCVSSHSNSNTNTWFDELLKKYWKCKWVTSHSVSGHLMLSVNRSTTKHAINQVDVTENIDFCINQMWKCNLWECAQFSAIFDSFCIWFQGPLMVFIFLLLLNLLYTSFLFLHTFPKAHIMNNLRQCSWTFNVNVLRVERQEEKKSLIVIIVYLACDL